MIKYKKIGIMGAMDAEVKCFLDAIKSPKEEQFAGTTFTTGTIGDTLVVLTMSGIGKVNGATTASALIMHFGVEAIIMTGVCGGVNQKHLAPVVPTGFVQHDVDMIGDEKGYLEIVDKIIIPADEYLSGLLAGGNAVRGVMATGEQFISTQAQIDRILQDFPYVVAVDMEAGAVAQVATRLNVPFACIKIVSDDGTSGDVYFDFKSEASRLSAGRVVELLNRI